MIKITETELEKIRQFTRKDITEQELYSFPLILCDNEIDRDGEKFTAEALEKLAALFVGKTGIFDHDPTSKNQTARIYSAEVKTDSARKTADGETYTYIEAKAYMLRSEKNKDLISEIEAGIKKETSVGCSVGSIRCSVCGKELRSGHCGHIKGKVYDGKICCNLLCEPADAYEWSFVAVPSQKNAGVIKSYSPEKTAQLACEIRDELSAGIMKDAAIILPEIPHRVISEICGAAELGILKELRDAMRAQAAKNSPLARQLVSPGEATPEDCSEFKI